MSVFKKGFVVLFFMLGVLIYADPLDVTVATYYIPSTYTDTVFKTNTTVMGGYGYFGLGTSALELGYDQVLGTLSHGSVQQNYLGIYSYYLPGIQLKAGFVGVRPNGGNGNGDVFLLGGSYDQYNEFGYKAWSAGSELFASMYTGTSAITVYQVSPGGHYFMASPWTTGWFDFSGKVTGIFTSDNRSLFSEELGVKYNWDAYSVGATYYLGETTYGIYNGGFVVFNTADKLLSGYALSGKYVLGSFSFTANYQSQNMLASGATQTTVLSKMGGLVTYHF